MIAILGATGYVGGSLARLLAADSRRPLVLFARDPSRLRHKPWPANVEIQQIDSFSAERFDLVINAIGVGSPARVKEIGEKIVDITDSWDRRVLDTMRPDTRYVFLSSGAIYGEAFLAPVQADSKLSIGVNALEDFPGYVLAKLLAEFRHRQLPELHILDLRIFAYADPSILETPHFFLADLAQSIRHKLPLKTPRHDFVRDYVGAEEILALISAWDAAGAPSGPADAYSLAPVSKINLLTEAERRFGLDIQWDTGTQSSETKSIYASQFQNSFGYTPKRTSLEVVFATLETIAGFRALQ